MPEEVTYKYLEPRPCSNYRCWFVKGRRLRALILYRETIGQEPRTPEEVALDFRLPHEAILESVDYCQRFPDVLQRDWDMEEASIRGADQPDAPARIS